MILVRKENIREYMKCYPVTSLLLLFVLLTMIYTSLIGGLRDSSILNTIGGIDPVKIKQGEYFRFISYAFIHDGLTHFLFNSFFIFFLGAPVEKLIGKINYTLLFLGSVLSCSAACFLFNQQGVGSSGFGYGLFGILFGWILTKKTFIDSDSKTAVLVFILGGWISTFTIPHVSILGHAAGFAAGILLSFFFDGHSYSIDKKADT